MVLGFNTKLNKGTNMDKFITSNSENTNVKHISIIAFTCCFLVYVLEKKKDKTEKMYILLKQVLDTLIKSVGY